jgi:hypothetical protein
MKVHGVSGAFIITLDFAGRSPIIQRMKAENVSRLRAVLAILFLLGLCSPLHAVSGRFFVHLDGGASFPSLASLNDELAVQGQDEVGAGYGLGVSLGHSLMEERWSLEIHFAATFYPSFDYENEYEYFPSEMKHYSFALVARHNFMSESERYHPSLGAGVGYGQTNLVAGGGKLAAAEGLLTGRFGVSIRSNLEIALECTYYAGLQTKEFRAPFLENVNADVVLNSAGKALEDRFRSLDARLGLTIRLKPVTQ